MNCSQCHAPAAPGAGFCNRCGATLGGADPAGETQVLGQPQAPSSATSPPVMPAPEPTVPLASSVVHFPPDGNSGQVRRTGAPEQREETIVVKDVSSSMSAMFDSRFSKLSSAQRAAVTLVLQRQTIDDLDEVGVVSFNCTGHQILPPCSIRAHKREIIQAIESLTAGGGTDP